MCLCPSTQTHPPLPLPPLPPTHAPHTTTTSLLLPPPSLPPSPSFPFHHHPTLPLWFDTHQTSTARARTGSHGSLTVSGAAVSQQQNPSTSILPSSSLVPSFLLVSRRSPPASWLPVVFLFCPWCCSESEDSVINLRTQHSNCLWYLFDFLIPCTWSPSQVSLRYNLSSNSLYLHTLPTSKLHQQNRFFFVGSWPRHSCL